MTFSKSGVSVRYPVRVRLESWELPEGTVPESIPHDVAAQRIKALLDAWKARTERSVWIARNLAIRWLEQAPRIGIDPDVCVLEPPPPEARTLSSLCLWKPGHHAPTICFEIVSSNHPHKDYVEIQDRYAAMGTRELVVFDPLLEGPIALGGPVPLQLWRRDNLDLLERVHCGNGPVYSEVLNAWLLSNGTLLDIADDREGSKRWLTPEEHERAEKEHERTEKERERAEKERERAEKEREREIRIELERRLQALEAKSARPHD